MIAEPSSAVHRAEMLRDYLATVADAPVRIGVDDCGPWVARWVEMITGRTVIFPEYTTREEGYALAAAAGGMVGLVAALLRDVGLWSSATAIGTKRGDIGVIALSDDRELPVIFANDIGPGDAWAIVVARAEVSSVRLMSVRLRYVSAVWSLPPRARGGDGPI